MSVLEIFEKKDRISIGAEGGRVSEVEFGRPRQVTPINSSTKSMDASLSERLVEKSGTSNYGSTVDSGGVKVHTDAIPTRRSWTAIDIHRWFYRDMNKNNEISKARARSQGVAIRNANAAIEFLLKKEIAEEQERVSSSGNTSSIPTPHVLKKYVQPVAIDEYRINPTRNTLFSQSGGGSGDSSPSRVELLQTQDSGPGGSTHELQTSDSQRTTRDSDYVGYIEGTKSAFHFAPTGTPKGLIGGRKSPTGDSRNPHTVPVGENSKLIAVNGSVSDQHNSTEVRGTEVSIDYGSCESP